MNMDVSGASGVSAQASDDVGKVAKDGDRCFDFSWSQESAAGENVDKKEMDSDIPCFDFTGISWSPEPPAGLHFLSLVPLDSGYEARSTDTSPAQHSLVRKMKTCRKGRRSELCKQKPLGREVVHEKKLRQAASLGDSSAVEDLLDSGVDPGGSDEKKRTALHIAAAKGHEQIVSLLLNGGADPNQKDTVGNTPLHLAACTNHIPVVTLLLRGGTDVNALDQSGRTPLHLALARLRLLHDEAHFTSDQLKLEVNQIVSMMREYLHRTGRQDLSELDSLCSRLENTSTREEIGALGGLLSDFASLQIQRQDKPS